MRKMKDSGIKWIGKIPETWEVTINKTILKNISERNHPDAEVLSLYRDLGVVPKNSRDDNHNVTSENTIQYKFVEKGSLVINKMKAWQGSLAVSNYEGIVSPAYYVCKFRDNQISKDYVHYLLRSSIYAQQFERLSTGMRIGQWDLSIDDFLATPLLVPPEKEQAAIAKCLDKKSMQIDALIANVQEQIEKLKAYKQSLITEVVTKGLDPNVPMKDSGVEWIGEIPKCWNMVRGKALFEECDARSDDGSEELLTVSQYTGVTPRSQKSVNMFESTTLEGYKICEVGDIAANTMWLWAGAIGVSEYRGVISPSYNVYRQKEIKYISSYLDCLLRIPLLVQEYASRSTGIRASRLRLYPKDFMDIMFPVPPIEEQKTIMDILGKKIDMVNQMISIKQSKIEKLELYKRSLIYEYVTGKKEVS